MMRNSMKRLALVFSIFYAVSLIASLKAADPGSASDFSTYLATNEAKLPFTFAVVGDIQGKGHSEKWKSAAAWIASKKTVFWISLGDTVDHGLKQDEWEAFKADGAILLSSSPIIPVIGNHDCYLDKAPEQFPSLFYEQFPFFKFGKERPDGWYSFDYSNVHFIVLNNYPIGADGKKDKKIISNEERQWLEKDLSSSKKKWNFVFMHEPLYSSGPHGGGTNCLIPAWCELFDKYHVDIVFSGHTHAFELTCPIFNLKKADNPDTGTIYYNAAGVNYSAAPKGDWFTVASQKEDRICLIPILKVDEKSVTVETWNLSNNSVYNSFEIKK